MIIAHHLIWTAYGTWLPNDLRGSGSTTVRAYWLAELGKVHVGRKAKQPRRGEVQDFYADAMPRLKHDVVRFKAAQRNAIADAFGEVIGNRPYKCFACAIMPDHVHLVIRRHRDDAEDMIERLQTASREVLIARDLVPANHPVWTHGGCRKFLDTPEAVRRTIVYVECNPLGEGLPPQTWPFVVAYDGWRPNVALPPNSAQRLRV